MEKEKKNKKLILIVGILAILLVTVGVTYAFFTFARSGKNQQLVAGDIYMHYEEGEKTINIEDALPAKTYNENDYFEFTIDGKNTYEDKDIWYEIILNEGLSPDEARTERLDAKYLKFTLFENDEKVLDGVSYETLENQRIWVNTINKNTKEEVNITYKLYMWISDEVVIGEGGYDFDTWNDKVFASVRVDVKGDFTEKKAALPINSIITKNVGKNGIVAIDNTGASTEETTNIREYRYSGKGNYCTYNDGETDYDLQIEGNTCPAKACVISQGPMTSVVNMENDAFKVLQDCTSMGGTEVNLKDSEVHDSGLRNYIKFNDEMWRIVGIFGDKVKIVKDTPVSSGIPETYTSSTNGKKYGIIYGSSAGAGAMSYLNPMSNVQVKPIASGGPDLSSLKYPYVMYNSGASGGIVETASIGPSPKPENQNDWTEAGLQYYLNEENGYLGNIKSNYKNLLQEETYYLGNVTINNSTYAVEGTANDIYNQEHGSTECDMGVSSWTQNYDCNIWNGNKATWPGKVSLLYPSDYAYAADKSYWTTDMGEYPNAAAGNDWLNNTDAAFVWTLSPASDYSNHATGWSCVGDVGGNGVYVNGALRPVLNLKSNVLVTGEGSYDNPYELAAAVTSVPEEK